MFILSNFQLYNSIYNGIIQSPLIPERETKATVDSPPPQKAPFKILQTSFKRSMRWGTWGRNFHCLPSTAVDAKNLHIHKTHIKSKNHCFGNHLARQY